MRLALHIFRKDVRHLWPQIGVALILVVGHAILDVLQTPAWRPGTERINELAGLTSFLLPVAWWSLIAALIYEEMLPGDRQFWVTGPYSWPTLLGAKVLFIVAFVNLPLLVSDCFILGAQGFPVVSNLPDLVLRELVVSSWLILPAFALATLTSGMGQFVLTLLAVITGIITEEFLLHSAQRGSALEVTTGKWGLVVVLLALAAVVPWQYWKRRTQAARLMLASVLFVIVPGLSAIPGAGNETPETTNPAVDVSKVRVTYDLTRAPSTGTKPQVLVPPNILLLPLRVTGLPRDAALVTRGDDVAIGGEDQKRLGGGGVQRRGDDYFEVVYLDPPRLRAIRSGRVSLRDKLRLTVVTDRVTTKAASWQERVRVPGMGRCEAFIDLPSDAPSILCETEVHSAQAARVWIEYPGYRSEPIDSGQVNSGSNVLWGLSPVEKWVIGLSGGNPLSSDVRAALNHPGSQLSFTVQWPLAYATRELTLRDADLAPFLAAR